MSHSSKWLNPKRDCGNLWFIASPSEEQVRTSGIQLVSEGGEGGRVHSIRTELNCRTPSWHPENQSAWGKTHSSGVLSTWEVLYERRNTKFFPFQRQKSISSPQHNKKGQMWRRKRWIWRAQFQMSSREHPGKCWLGSCIFWNWIRVQDSSPG